MKTIYKYPLALTDVQTVEMPHGAELLSVQSQYGLLCLWALVESSNYSVGRRIVIYGTGNPVNESPGRFIDTVQLDWMVWHVFEEV